MTACNGRDRFYPTHDPSVRITASLAHYSGLGYARPFSGERGQPCQPPSASARRRPTSGRPCTCASAGRTRRVLALLVAGVAEVHQFPDRVVLVGLGQFITAIPCDRD